MSSLAADRKSLWHSSLDDDRVINHSDNINDTGETSRWKCHMKLWAMVVFEL
jgi:hypothetical protein